MKTIIISLPDKTIELLPVHRSKLGVFKQLLLGIQTKWIEYGLDTGEVCIDVKCWKNMKKAISMLPRKDNPQIGWDDLDLIGGDYGQIEALFFCQEQDARRQQHELLFDLDKFQACKLAEIHYFNARKMLIEADSNANKLQ